MITIYIDADNHGRRRVRALDRGLCLPQEAEEVYQGSADMRPKDLRDKSRIDVVTPFVGVDAGVLAAHALKSVSLLTAIAEVGRKIVFVDLEASDRYLLGERWNVRCILDEKLGGHWVDCRDLTGLNELMRRVSQHLQTEAVGADESLRSCETAIPGGLNQAPPYETRSVMPLHLHAKMPISGASGEAAFLGLVDELHAVFREGEWEIDSKGWKRIASYLYSKFQDA